MRSSSSSLKRSRRAFFDGSAMIRNPSVTHCWHRLAAGRCWKPKSSAISFAVTSRACSKSVSAFRCLASKVLRSWERSVGPSAILSWLLLGLFQTRSSCSLRSSQPNRRCRLPVIRVVEQYAVFLTSKCHFWKLSSSSDKFGDPSPALISNRLKARHV